MLSTLYATAAFRPNVCILIKTLHYLNTINPEIMKDSKRIVS